MSHKHKGGCCDDASAQSIDTPPSGTSLHQPVIDYNQPSYPCITTDPCPEVCDLYTPTPQDCCLPSAAPCHTPPVVSACAPPACAPNPCVPHYRQALAPENNRQVIIRERLVGTFKNRGAFAMPACGAKVRVEFDKVGDVPIGAWLWAYGLGYLKITAFFPTNGEVELENECPELDCGTQVQAAPGTPIPKCTVFVIQAPLCSGATASSIINFPYLNGSFTVPMVGNCVDVPVTNTNGLSVNAVVSIGGGRFRVGAIYSSTLISICNDGSAVAGTYVEFQDGAGNLIIPISLIQSNICLNSPVDSGQLIVCKNNTQQPLVGSLNGQIPVFDLVTGEVTFQTLDVPVLDCTVLTAGITINPTFPPGTVYTATVADTSAYHDGQMVRIAGSRFLIISIQDQFNITVLPQFPTTGGFVGFQPGNTFCSVGCCEELGTRVDALDSIIPTLTGSWAEANQAQTDLAAQTLLAVTGNTVATPVCVLSTTNSSMVYQMGVVTTFESHFKYQYEGTAGQACEVSRTIRSSGAPGLVALPVGTLFDDMTTHVMIPVPGSPFVNRDTYHVLETMYFTVPPGGTFTLAVESSMTLNGSDLATGVRVEAMSARISLLGVAVR